MAISLDEAMGIGAPPNPQAKGSSSPSTTVSFDEAMGGHTATAVPDASKSQSLTKLAEPFVKPFATRYHQDLDAATAAVKQSGRAITAPEQESDLLAGPKNLGEGLLGVMNWIWTASGVPTSISMVASDPTRAGLRKGAEVMPLAPGVSRQDVRQSSEAMGDFMDTLYQTAAGFWVGGGATAETGKGAMGLLTPEARAEYKARPARAVARVESAFDELAATAPEDAHELATKTAEVSPKTAKYMRDRINKFVVASEKDLNEIGVKAAKANLEDLEAKLPKNLAGLAKKPEAAKPDPKTPPPPPPTNTPPPPPPAEVVVLEISKSIATAANDSMNSSAKAEAMLAELGQKEVPTKVAPEMELEKARVDRIKKQLDKVIDTPREAPGRAEKLAKLRADAKVAAARIAEMRKPKAEAPVEDEATAIWRRREAEDRPRIRKRGEPEDDDDEPILFHAGLNVPEAFNMVRKTKAGQVMEGKLFEYYDFLITHINPEALGTEARKAGAILAKGVAGLAHEDSKFVHRSEVRRLFWEKNNKLSSEFIRRFEKGQDFKNPQLKEISDHMRQWNKDIYEQDRRNGIDYGPVDHYLSHQFEDDKAVREWLESKFGPSWTKPGFTKDRGFDLYEQAIAAGFKPKFTNPEDIMLSRQHASDVAQMKVEALKELERQGLAVKKTPGGKVPFGGKAASQPSPAGGSYWVHSDAHQVLHNAFNTQSLWTMKGPGGDLFRGAMALKNFLIPIKLGLSLFHPLHVQTIDNATAMVRASKELLAGTQNPAQWAANMSRALTYKGIWDNPKSGGRILRAFQGKISEGELTAADRESIRLMAEGGFIPEMSSQYRMRALDNYKTAVARQGMAAQWRAPFAAYDWLQGQVFQHWIPSLKIASYLHDAQTALKLNPNMSSTDRMLMLRKLSKSVDNRYGEMAYNTLFWNRWVKDLAVANTLSLGWQLGFIREYGGGMLDVGQALTREGTLASKAKSGMLDRPLFITFYTAQALGYGGLMTWAMTGQSPKSLLDYIYPKTGEKNRDGSDARVGTMFYTKEFAATEKHIETQGVTAGLTGLVESKASGLIGLAIEGVKGVNTWGDEIRDPDGTFVQKLGQTMAAAMPELTPISIGAIQKLQGKGFVDKVGGSPWKSAGAVAGFTPAPKYITESSTNARIDQIYNTYNAPKQTPYEKAQYSKDTKELRELHNADDMDGFDDKLSEIQDKYKLTGAEARKLRTHIQKGEDPQLKKFEGFTIEQKKKLLDQMTPEERDKYLPHAGHKLRYSYEEPETAE